jgi:hypothetical protein
MPWRDFTHYRKQQVKPAHKRPVFVLALRAEPHVADPVRALRHALKRLLRDHGLRVVAIHERRGDIDHVSCGRALRPSVRQHRDIGPRSTSCTR